MLPLTRGLLSGLGAVVLEMNVGGLIVEVVVEAVDLRSKAGRRLAWVGKGKDGESRAGESVAPSKGDGDGERVRLITESG